MNESKTKPPRTTFLYTLKMLFNGESFTKRTNNIEEAILDLKPELLHTELYFVLDKKGSEEPIERKLNLVQGRKLFINEDFRAVFLNNLLLQ